MVNAPVSKTGAFLLLAAGGNSEKTEWFFRNVIAFEIRMRYTKINILCGIVHLAEYHKMCFPPKGSRVACLPAEIIMRFFQCTEEIQKDG